MKKVGLQTALKLARPVLSTSSIIPGLDCFYFNKNKVTAFNTSLAITAEFDFDFPVTGYISGNPLYRFLSELDEDIEVIAKDSAIEIQSGRSKVLFPVRIAESLFNRPAQVGESRLPVSAFFAAGIRTCLASLGGKYLYNPEDAGISVFTKNNECELLSSNGITYSKYTLILEEPLEEGAVLLPAAFCEQFDNLFTELSSCPQEVVFSAQGTYIRAVFNNVVLHSSFYALPVRGNIQDQFNIFLQGLETISIPKGLQDVLKRSEIIASKDQPNIEIIYGKRLEIRAVGAGDLVEVLDVPYSSEGKVNIDVRNIRRVIDSCARIGFKDASVFLVGADDHFQHIIRGKE